MFLRALVLRGFKSFALKTSLEFAPGVSVIVGPNGSGKSNLVDAITWVLGEQGPRALRGASMADVIFAGSPKRPALGMAEVHLVIDNSAGLIPVPLAELEISRAVYRSGESQYFIGRKPVRLMDVQELLAESGIGRELHTVVGQNQLEDVLTARPEERRRFIEEAAGIAKHRRRRERAERRLASVEQDVLRLQDVLAELNRQLRPLRRQAESAKRHDALQQEAAAIAARLAAVSLRDLYAVRDARRGGWDAGLARRRDLEERLAGLDERLAELARAAKVEAATEARWEAEAAVRAAVRAEADARAGLAEHADRAAHLALLAGEARRAGEALEAVRAALAEREPHLAVAEAEFAEAARAREAAESEARRAHEEATGRRAEAEALGRSLEAYERERGLLAASLGELERRIARAEADRVALEGEVERLDAAETPLSRDQARLERERTALHEEVSGLREREARLSARLAGLAERAAVRSETPARRFVRERPGRAPGLLSDLIRAEPGYERALAAALGALSDAVAAESLELAVEDVRGAAGVTFAVGHAAGGWGLGQVARPVARSAGPRPASEPLEGDVPAGPETLLEHLRVDPKAAGIAGSLLRDVYLADDPADALRGARQRPGARFVTTAGELVGPDIVRAVGKAGEAERANAAAREAAERELREVTAGLRRREQALAAADADLAALAGRLDEADARITAAADRMGALGADLASLTRERQVVSERLAALDEAAGAWRDALAAIPPPSPEPAAPPERPEPPMALRVEVEAMRRDAARLEVEAARARAELDAARSEDPEALAASSAAAERARAAAEEALAEAEAGRSAAALARADVERAEGEIRRAEDEANHAWREVSTELARLRDEYEEEDQARRDLERRIEEAERVLHEGHRRAPAEAVSELTEDDAAELLRRRADLVARRLALLGRVNLLAGDELEALQERHDFLARELEDVRGTRRELLTLIEDVDRRILATFDAAFRDVATAFEDLFAGLFPGGEGRIALTEHEDPMQRGVDIEARPGRKRVKRLSLLSGGERALTAICFLFAIFRARPSPFYLLDEVEAALDDINLHRFLDLVRGFAATSQVLLVTHQKRTMEIADVLYGVSLGADGVSTVIAQRLERDRFEQNGPATPDEPVVTATEAG